MRKKLNQKIQSGYLAQHNLYNFSKLSKSIKANEGFRSCVYKDQFKKPTIGYGHLITVTDVFFNNKKYSKEILVNIFYKDLKKSISDFKKNYNYKNMPNCVQETIIEMIFQLGISGVLKFKKFNLHIKKKQYYLAALEMMKSRWYDQTPNRANKLIATLLKFNDR